MTENYQGFEKYVNGKFGSMSVFSKVITGSFMTLKGIQNTNDDDRINRLYKDAKRINFVYREAFITKIDRLMMESKLDEIIMAQRIQNDRLFPGDKFMAAAPKYKKSDWLRENGIDQSWFSSVIKGRLKNKNKAFKRCYDKIIEDYKQIKTK